MPRAIAPKFLNVDFDLRSRLAPAPFIAAFAPRYTVQDLGKQGRRYWVHLGGRSSADTPSDSILEYARMFDRMPPDARRVFDRALREFDIGFEAGSNVPQAGEWVLSKRALEAAARLGATIRVTVYEPSEIVEARQRPVRKN